VGLHTRPTSEAIVLRVNEQLPDHARSSHAPAVAASTFEQRSELLGIRAPTFGATCSEPRQEGYAAVARSQASCRGRRPTH
jgi:hypothetical protein